MGDGIDIDLVFFCQPASNQARNVRKDAGILDGTVASKSKPGKVRTGLQCLVKGKDISEHNVCTYLKIKELDRIITALVLPVATFVHITDDHYKSKRITTCRPISDKNSADITSLATMV